MRDIMSPLDGVISPLRRKSGFSPASLFAAGEQGVWYDPSDFSTMFQDSGGTTPVTAVEQPVGLILDKSGRGNHASQATTTSMPLLSAKVNLLKYSEQLDSATWTKVNVNVTADQIENPINAAVTAELLVPTTTSGVHSVSQSIAVPASKVTISFYVKASGYSRVAIRENTSSGDYSSYLLSASGSILANGGGGVGAVTSLAAGWYRVSMTHTPASAGNKTYALYIENDSYTGTAPQSYTYAGNGTSGIYVWGAQLETGSSANTYQRVADLTDYDTTGFPLYLKFDGTDDSLATGTINPGSVDKVSLFSGVRKISDAAQGLVAELSASVALNNGAFALTAPNSAAANYNFSSKGTTQVDNTVTTYTAPLTSVLTGLGDISAPSNIIRVNGTQASAVTTTQGTGNYGSATLYIGRRGGSTLPFNGNLYSLIVRFSAANLDAGAIAKAETWVNGKTGAY